jgi:hypothetical protein
VYRILHVGLGPLGQRIIHDLYDRGLGRVVAAVDVNPDLAGKPLSALVKSAADDVAVMSDLDDFCGWDHIDAAIVTTASDLRLCADTFRKLLAHRVSIVSTCEELVWPWLRHKALADELHDLAQKSKGRLLGTGVNPGAMMDTIPVFATAVCRKVKSIEVHRIQDASPRRIPFQRKIGATLDEAAFKQGVKDGWLRHVGLGESLHFVAHYLGLQFDEWHESIEMVRAERDLSCGLGPIPKGHAAGVRQEAKGSLNGKAQITMIFQAAIGQADPQDRVIVDGEPRLDVVYRGGVHGDIATSAMTLNSIGSLLQTKPGLHTMATIPLPHWSAKANPVRAQAPALA